MTAPLRSIVPLPQKRGKKAEQNFNTERRRRARVCGELADGVVARVLVIAFRCRETAGRSSEPMLIVGFVEAEADVSISEGPSGGGSPDLSSNAILRTKKA